MAEGLNDRVVDSAKSRQMLGCSLRSPYLIPARVHTPTGDGGRRTRTQKRRLRPGVGSDNSTSGFGVPTKFLVYLFACFEHLEIGPTLKRAIHVPLAALHLGAPSPGHVSNGDNAQA